MKKSIPIFFGASIIIRHILYSASVDSPPLQPRIHKEIKDLKEKPIDGIVATPRADNSRHFDVELNGPKGSPYEEGVFKLEIILPDDYPMAAPKVRFLTTIYHPNVRSTGDICLDILQNNWSPVINIRTILISIQSILSTDPFEGLSSEIEKARRYTRLHAIKPSVESGSSSQSQPPPQQPSSSPVQLQSSMQPSTQPAFQQQSAPPSQSASSLRQIFLLQRILLQRAFLARRASQEAQASSQLEPQHPPQQPPPSPTQLQSSTQSSFPLQPVSLQQSVPSLQPVALLQRLQRDFQLRRAAQHAQASSQLEASFESSSMLLGNRRNTQSLPGQQPQPQQPSSSQPSLALQPASLQQQSTFPPQSALSPQQLSLLQHTLLQRAFPSRRGASHEARASSQLEPSSEPSLSTLIGNRRGRQRSPESESSSEPQSPSELQSSPQPTSADVENTHKRRKQG